MARRRQSQAPVLIVYVTAMLVSLVVFGAAALVLREMFVVQPKLKREAENAAQQDQQVQDEPQEADYSKSRETVLLISEDGGTVNWIAAIRVLPDMQTVRIVPIPNYTWTNVSGVDGTVQELFRTGGLTYLRQAAETALGVSFDKYIKISNDGWANFVDYLGGTSDYYFPEDIYYKNADTGEITSFSKGSATRTLYGDDIRRIITYPLYSDGNAAKLRAEGELLSSLINSACTYNSGSVVGNIQTIFNVIYNNSDTDITSKSFADVRDAYEYLISETLAPATYRIPSGTWDQRGYFIVDESFKTELESYFELAEEQSVLNE